MSSPTVETPAETVIASDAAPVEAPSSGSLTVEAYQKTLLGAAIKAATLLDELMELSIIPDPRVKDAADVALQLVALMNAQPNVQPNAQPNAQVVPQVSQSAGTKKTTKAKAS